MSYQFITSAKLPTRHGEFDIHIFENEAGQEHIMLTVGLSVVDQNTHALPNDRAAEKPIPLVRIHSECLTGDAFSSLKCDCGPQLNTAMQAIQESGCGAILYLRQEGRGIGLTNKIRAYAHEHGYTLNDINTMLSQISDFVGIVGDQPYGIDTDMGEHRAAHVIYTRISRQT